MLHELGHFTAPAAFGYEMNRPTYQNVRTGSTPEGVDPALADGLSFAADTSVSLVLLALAVWWVAARGPHPLALALAVFESVRVLLSLVARVAGAGVAETLTGGFGELRYGVRGLGGPRPWNRWSRHSAMALPRVPRNDPRRGWCRGCTA